MSRFKVTGMSCGGCVNRVTKAIKAVDPDATVVIDLPSGLLTVENTKVLPIDIIATVEYSGYGTTEA